MPRRTPIAPAPAASRTPASGSGQARAWVRQQYTVFSKSPTSAKATAVTRTAGHSRHVERLAGEGAERAHRAPAHGEVGGKAIQDRAARAGQEQVPEQHPEHVSVGGDERFLDREAHYLLPRSHDARGAAPFLEERAGAVDVARLDRQLDVGEVWLTWLKPSVR